MSHAMGMTDLDDLSEAFQTSEALIVTADQNVKSAAEINEARLRRDRSWIAIFIISTYALAVFGVVLYLLFWGPTCIDSACTHETALWEKQSEFLLNLIFTAVVPIVTLMLGFYFGSEKSSPSQTSQSE